MIKKGKATELSQGIADILGGLRGSLGLTQREMADNIGVTVQQYQKYEKGKDRLPLERALVLCAALNMPLGRFMDALGAAAAATGFAEEGQAAFGRDHDPDDRIVSDIWRTIPPARRTEFLEVMRKTAKMMRNDSV
jgi:transcriptional regulator with XRE-family HTH domain